MATLQKIRNRAGILISIVIGLALFAFILSDFLNTGGKSNLNSKSLQIAEVAGKSISYIDYQNKIDYITDITTLYSGESSLDEERIEQIRDQSWDQILREYVLEKEYKKLGISVHPDEVFDMVQGRNVHPFIRQLFTDQKTGQFNQLNVIRFLKSMDEDPTGNQKVYWLFLENEIINERKYTKYNNLISKGLYVPTELAIIKQQESDKSVNLDYIVQRFTSIPDSLIEISEEDIKNYYKKNKNNYKQEASRDIVYVVFNVIPSADDDRIAKEWIDKVYPEFIETEDDKDYVNYNSDTPFDDKNYKNGELSETINDFMFNAKIGDVFGPYFENDAYKIAKLTEINYLPDSVKARHILIDPGQTKESDEKAKATADSLKELLLKGADFKKLSKEYSIDPGTADKGGDLGWFQEGTMVKPFNDSCFTSNIGDIKIAKSQFGYHIIEILDKGQKVKKVKVALIERYVEPSTETYQFYYAKASQFAGKYNNYDKFINGIEAEGLTQRTANDLKELDKQIPGLENSREIVRWAYNAELHNLSPIFELGNSFVVAILSDLKKEGFADIEEVRSMISAEVKKEKKAEKIVENINEVITGKSNLGEIAQILNTEVKQADNIRFSSFSIPDAGIEPKVIAAASSIKKNIISDPIIGNNGVYVITVNLIEAPSEDINIEFQKNNLKRQYQTRANYEAYETLKELADIKDYRSKFY